MYIRERFDQTPEIFNGIRVRLMPECFSMRGYLRSIWLLDMTKGHKLDDIHISGYPSAEQ